MMNFRNKAAAPTSRLRPPTAQADEAIFIFGFSGQAIQQFVHLDPPVLISSWGSRD
jgi:hypothetical protein